MSKQNNLKDYLTDLYEGISTKRPNASRNPQNFRAEIESIEGEKAKLQEKTLTANGVYPPDSGYDGFSKVTVDVAGKVLPKYDGEVIIEGEPESGGGESGDGGSAEFNIAYGDTAPSDTSKLWVKANEPEAVSITSSVVTASEEFKGSVTALPTQRGVIGTAAIGAKIYLLGGSKNSSTAYNVISVFDTESNTIETLSATLPDAVAGAASAAVGTKVYLFGGRNASNAFSDAIYVFDTVTNTAEKLSTKLPGALSGITAVSVGTKIYLFGGHGTGSYSNAYRDYIYAFNTENNTISLFAHLPRKIGYIGAALAGTKVYLFGGTSDQALNGIYVFDVENGNVETLSGTLRRSASGITAATVGTKIYLFGGSNDYDVDYDDINVFDTETNTVRALNFHLPKALHSIKPAVVGTKIYLVGGQTENNATFSNTINMFEATMPLATNNMLIEASATKNRFNLLPNVELGVNNVYLGNANGNAERVKAHFHRVTSGVDYENYYTSSALEIATGTTLTSSVKCNIGDLVVAAIATRDTLTLSDGWTLVSTSGINSTDTTGNGQRLSWAYKFATSTTESITVTQATAQRLYINMVALQGATGVVDNGYSYVDNTTDTSITVAKPSGLILWGMSANLWSTESPYTVWTTSNEMPIIQLGESTQSRLGIGLDQSTDANVTFKPASTAPLTVGSLTVQGMDKFYTATPFTRAEWVEV